MALSPRHRSARVAPCSSERLQPVCPQHRAREGSWLEEGRNFLSRRQNERDVLKYGERWHCFGECCFLAIYLVTFFSLPNQDVRSQKKKRISRVTCRLLKYLPTVGSQTHPQQSNAPQSPSLPLREHLLGKYGAAQVEK